jgi:hypothetical protein
MHRTSFTTKDPWETGTIHKGYKTKKGNKVEVKERLLHILETVWVPYIIIKLGNTKEMCNKNFREVP